MLFLVKGTVEISHYMDKTEKQEDMRLVRADSMDEAREKYEDWWIAKSRDYGTSYSVWYAEVLETIE